MLQHAEDVLAHSCTLARIPEHSLGLMCAMSQGEAFCIGPYLFFHAENWLISIAYPLYGKYDVKKFDTALEAALHRCGQDSIDCWAIGPDLPPSLLDKIVNRDRFYVLSAQTHPPVKLKGPLRKAQKLLRVDETRQFTPSHRRLWAEFMGRTERGEAAPLPPYVRELYLRTPEALHHGNDQLRLLNAWDSDGHLVASLLLDYAPEKFVSYVLGVYSRTYYVPHASDLLFAKMLENSRQTGKKYIHLGLGVNEGILRFKKKWGAVPSSHYIMAAWQHRPFTKEQSIARDFALAFLRANSEGWKSKRQIMSEISEQRPFAMLWKVEKCGKVSWIGGTAHFFRYSFEDSLRKLFRQVDNILFEGPLDDTFMANVDKNGKDIPDDFVPLLDLLSQEELDRLERTVRGPEGWWARLLNMELSHKADVRGILSSMRPWCAFFTLWSAFLERHGWKNSVDMEAWRIARDMGRNVIGMETLEEQLTALNSVPVERVLNFFRDCHNWKTYALRNLRSYLAGDLEGMMGTSAEFPTRTGTVISLRDQRFRERMQPYLEEGGCAVFVGAAHMVNLRRMLSEDGYKVHRCLPTLSHKLRALCKGDKEVDWW